MIKYREHIKYGLTVIVLWIVYSILIWVGINHIWQLPERIMHINPSFLEILWFVLCVNVAVLNIKDFKEK